MNQISQHADTGSLCGYGASDFGDKYGGKYGGVYSSGALTVHVEHTL